ncbi:MAG: hypothetical protein K2I33_05250, partial [Oscillospiraceae bacterium]|nr:hypothetical protein [Oscillospiraceae bacterium]
MPAYAEEQWINCISKNCYTKPVLFPYDGKIRASLQTALILSQSRQTGTVIDETAVIDTLKDKLPDYMIPRFVIEVQKFPLTDNGKVDVKSLPEMSIASTDRVAVVPPETELQAKLLELWKENLNVQDMGITDNYFAMGGDSLKAIRLMSRLGESGY